MTFLFLPKMTKRLAQRDEHAQKLRTSPPTSDRQKRAEKSMRTQSMADSVRYPAMTTAQVREAFLIDALFRPGELHQVHVDLDRAVVGMAAPLRSPIGIIARGTLRAAAFTRAR